MAHLLEAAPSLGTSSLISLTEQEIFHCFGNIRLVPYGTNPVLLAFQPHLYLYRWHSFTDVRTSQEERLGQTPLTMPTFGQQLNFLIVVLQARWAFR